jgi:hypothetical protein
MTLTVISRPIGVVVKFSVIVKICKYEVLHEGYHIISMAMEVHNAHGCDMDRLIRECVCLFQNRRSKHHLSLFLYI